MDELDDGSSDAAGAKYRAPALEKGLDILQLLSNERTPLTLSIICARLKRSQGEIFRMVQVLQTRGFIDQDPRNDGFYLTDLLFSMAMRQPVTQSLVAVAIPTMRALATDIGQSCHIALYSRGDIVVVARMESVEQIGFTVRVGYRLPFHLANSGSVLFAFQPDDVRARWLAEIAPRPKPDDVAHLRDSADKTRAMGYAKRASPFVAGVTDLSVPVLRGDRAAAALTVPYLKTFHPRGSIAEVVGKLKQAAGAITDQLSEADARA